jgi:hypothetical protein
MEQKTLFDRINPEPVRDDDVVAPEPTPGRRLSGAGTVKNPTPAIQLDGIEPTARHSDPETSHQAAERATERAPSQRFLALSALVLAGDEGLTDFELAVWVNSNQNSIGVRRGELVKVGLVEATDKRRPSPTNSPTIVWRATANGRALVEADARLLAAARARRDNPGRRYDVNG